MTDINRRHVSALLAAAFPLVAAGCAAQAGSVITEAGTISATVVTDVAALTNKFAIIKGIAQVALVTLSITDPAAAAIITAGIALVDGWVASGSAAVSANAGTIITTTDAVLAAAAPAITAVANAASSAAK